jgi:hypothetical protein
MTSIQPDFFGRLFFAGANVLVPLHTGFIVTYFIVTYFIGNSLERDHSWLVDALGYALPLFFIPSLFLLPAAVYRRSVILSALATVPMA